MALMPPSVTMDREYGETGQYFDGYLVKSEVCAELFAVALILEQPLNPGEIYRLT